MIVIEWNEYDDNVGEAGHLERMSWVKDRIREHKLVGLDSLVATLDPYPYGCEAIFFDDEVASMFRLRFG